MKITIKITLKKYNFFSEEKSNVIPVSLLELKTDSQKFWLLDVRSEYEHSKYNLGGKNIPIYDIDFLMNEIPYGNNILAYCNEGQSAKQAALLISRKCNCLLLRFATYRFNYCLKIFYWTFIFPNTS